MFSLFQLISLFVFLFQSCLTGTVTCCGLIETYQAICQLHYFLFLFLCRLNASANPLAHVCLCVSTSFCWASRALGRISKSRQGRQGWTPGWDGTDHRTAVCKTKIQNQLLESRVENYYSDTGLPWWLRRWSIRLQCRRPGFDPWVGKIPWRRSIIEYYSVQYYSVQLEKVMAPHSSTLAWKIPWTEEPGRLQSTGLLRVGHDWETSLSLFTFMHWRRKGQPTPVFLPAESQGRGSLVGCRLWGRTESDTNEAT